MSGSARWRRRSTRRPCEAQKIGVYSRGTECREPAEPIGEKQHQHEPEPVARHGVERKRDSGNRDVGATPEPRLQGPDCNADEVAERERQDDQQARSQATRRPAWRSPGVRSQYSIPSRHERMRSTRSRTGPGAGGRAQARS